MVPLTCTAPSPADTAVRVEPSVGVTVSPLTRADVQRGMSQTSPAKGLDPLANLPQLQFSTMCLESERSAFEAREWIPTSEAQSCYPYFAVWGLCSAGCKTTDSGRAWRRAGAGAEEFVPPASFPKPRLRGIAPGYGSLAEYPCTPAHHTKQPAVGPQSGPSRWSSRVSGNLCRNGNARRCPRTTPVRETISRLCGED